MVTASITKHGQAPVEIVFESIAQPRIAFTELRVRTPSGAGFIAGEHVMEPFLVVVNADHIEAFEALIDGTCISKMVWMGTTGYEIESTQVWVLDEKGLEPGTYLLYNKSFKLNFPDDEVR